MTLIPKKGEISGHKYHDQDGDGYRDYGENGLKGWRIELYIDKDKDGYVDAGDKMVAVDYTDGGGKYEFKDLAAGNYVVKEVIQHGWYATNPADGDQAVKLTSYDDVEKDVNFLNTKYGTIKGHKYDDKDGDGHYDRGEHGLKGWTIQLYEKGDNDGDGKYDELLHTTTTDKDGEYRFDGLKLGDYTVKEVMKDGWEATGPEAIHVALEKSGEVDKDNDFLNHRTYGYHDDYAL